MKSASIPKTFLQDPEGNRLSITQHIIQSALAGHSRNRFRRNLGQHALDDFGPRVIAELLRALVQTWEDERAKKLSYRKNFYRSWAKYALSRCLGILDNSPLALLGFLFLVFLFFFIGLNPHWLPISAGAAFIAAVVIYLATSPANSKRRQTEPFEFREYRHIVNAVSSALIRQLNRLAPSDVTSICREESRLMLEVLRRTATPTSEYCRTELAIPILHLLPEVGDEEALEYVEILANWDRPEERVMGIVQAARTLVPRLSERLEHERAQHTLLRPIVEPEGSLLRPATDSPGHPD